jgi:CheY-like chemotaxis protein
MVTSVKRILLAEDSQRDVELTLAVLEEHNLFNEVVVVSDGAEALDYLYRRGKFTLRPPGNPGVVLLDLKMPKVDGLEVLRVIKGDAKLKSIPVVMLTSSREEPDLTESYKLGVNAYVVKPVDYQEFVKAVTGLGVFWAIINEQPLVETAE